MPSKDVLLQEIQDLRSKESVLMIGEILGVIVMIAGIIMLLYARPASNLRSLSDLYSNIARLVPGFTVVISGIGVLGYSVYTVNKCHEKKSQLMKQLESLTPLCPKCGKEVSSEFIVCPYCGEKLKT
jgi:tRNA(Ile2) C34 agmatinyltransferase TiaS